jgi:hypothetical protein
VKLPDFQPMNFFSVSLGASVLLIPLEKHRFDFRTIWAMIEDKLNHSSEEALVKSVVRQSLVQHFEIFKLT